MSKHMVRETDTLSNRQQMLTFSGTGTKVGDPIEAAAIHNVFSEGRTAKNPLQIGSVKCNFGHLENASGVISVIKAAMMLDKGFILPNTNFKTPNENIPLSEWNMQVCLGRPQDSL